jgi:hypothetical protein
VTLATLLLDSNLDGMYSSSPSLEKNLEFMSTATSAHSLAFHPALDPDMKCGGTRPHTFTRHQGRCTHKSTLLMMSGCKFTCPQTREDFILIYYYCCSVMHFTPNLKTLFLNAKRQIGWVTRWISEDEGNSKYIVFQCRILLRLWPRVGSE